MYTRCPHCLTVFIVGAEQLKAAHGNVRCGTCLESFDAIPYLSDGPVQPEVATREDEASDGESIRDDRSASEASVCAYGELGGILLPCRDRNPNIISGPKDPILPIADHLATSYAGLL